MSTSELFLKDEATARFIDDVYKKVWRTVARAHSGLIFEKGNDLFLAVSNTINIFFNLGIVLSNDHQGGKEHIQFIEEFAKKYLHASTPLIVAFPDYDGVSNFPDSIAELKYAPIEHFTRMELTDCSKSYVPPTPLTHIELVEISRENYAKWLELMAISNHMPEEISSVPISQLDSPYYSGKSNAEEMWLGYCLVVDGKFVATASSIGLFAEKCQYVFGVATHPEYQKKGFGTFVTWYAVDQVYKRTGLARTFLHSTTEGKTIYSKLGYETNGSCVIVAKVLP
jgi:hypothetical protein